MIRRRQFITLLGGAAAWPVAARAQQTAMPVVGHLSPGTPEETAYRVAPFRKGLGETGFIEGQNVAIEFRWAYNDNSRLPELAADLVRRRVSVIAAPASTPAALAAKAATATIPIVFGVGTDPVQEGLVASLNRPGGNVTGISFMDVEIAAKRLELLRDLLPGAVRFAVMVNPGNPLTHRLIKDALGAASNNGWQIEALQAGNAREINAAFANLVQSRADALLVAPDALFDARRVQLSTLAARHVPAIASNRGFAEVGGMMSYGPNFIDVIRQVGVYTGRILKGAKPTDLPVLQPAKFELVINIQTAIALGVEVPPNLLARADEVIE